ncbi:MAG: peptide-methionine (S)-S-oxide reductase [Halieaceae bacterium]|jgi:peptide-methionine (S)-S-oxide reductase
MYIFKTVLVTLLLSSALARAEPAVATFAGGCFWCMEAAFQDEAGVADVVSGFSGGDMLNPTYKGRHDGHYEVVQVSYDSNVISFQDLLDIYWINIDPFDPQGQFCDKGFSYKAAIFVADDSERMLAEASLQIVAERFSGDKVVTEILPAAAFWPVEESHQDYYLKNPTRYKYYKWNCGRQQRLDDIWGEG